MPKMSILIVDDEVFVRKGLAKLLDRDGFQVTAVRTAAEAKSVTKDNIFNLVMADANLLDATGPMLIKDLRERIPDLTAILITENSNLDLASNPENLENCYYIKKPINNDEVNQVISKIFVREQIPGERQQTKQNLAKHPVKLDKFVGDSEAIQRVYRLIEKVANTDSTVLVSGESGTGKEIVARTLHFSSQRAEKLFVPVNCGAIPAGLLESELFGHVKGAFTGAVYNREGRFQAANKGTLFLDEIGEMPPDLQVKLLRVLQTRNFEPVGSVKSVEVDARIIAATNIDLEEAVLVKRFREDLFYRLNVIPIHIPPLRDRRGDIPLLICHFLEMFNREKGCFVEIKDEEVMRVLMSYDWPGNVRELENIVQRLVILKQQGEIESKDLPQKLFNGKPRPQITNFFFSEFQLPADGVNFKDMVSAFEDHLLAQALNRTSGNKNKASELLKMNRTTLVEKLKKRHVAF